MTEVHAARVFAGAAHYTTRGGTRYRGGLCRKTLDGAFGDTPWQLLSAGLPENAEAGVIAFHPRERDVDYAGTQDGVYRSADSGDTRADISAPLMYACFSPASLGKDGSLNT